MRCSVTEVSEFNHAQCEKLPVSSISLHYRRSMIKNQYMYTYIYTHTHIYVCMYN